MFCKAMWGKRRTLCTMSGDPHTRTFDSWNSPRPITWHPMHADNVWYLVKTPATSDGPKTLRDVVIEAKYSKCGSKGKGGWQNVLYKGVPRTCTMGIAVAGEFLLSAEGFHYTLTIMPPCDWDWDNVRCTNPKDKSNLPRVEWCNDDSGCK